MKKIIIVGRKVYGVWLDLFGMYERMRIKVDRGVVATYAQHSTAQHTTTQHGKGEKTFLTKGIMIRKDMTGVVDVTWNRVRFGRQNNSEQRNTLPTYLYAASL